MRFSTLAIILASATSILAAPGAERRCEECDEETKGYGGPPPPPSPEFGGPPPPPSPGFGGPPPPPMPYFVPPPYYPTPFSAPSPFSGGESGSPCSGLESTPLCCQLDVEGIVDTPCESPDESVHTADELNEECAKTGYTGMCCLLPILGDGLLCSSP